MDITRSNSSQILFNKDPNETSQVPIERNCGKRVESYLKTLVNGPDAINNEYEQGVIFANEYFATIPASNWERFKGILQQESDEYSRVINSKLEELISQIGKNSFKKGFDDCCLDIIDEIDRNEKRPNQLENNKVFRIKDEDSIKKGTAVAEKYCKDPKNKKELIKAFRNKDAVHKIFTQLFSLEGYEELLDGIVTPLTESIPVENLPKYNNLWTGFIEGINNYYKKNLAEVFVEYIVKTHSNGDENFKMGLFDALGQVRILPKKIWQNLDYRGLLLLINQILKFQEELGTDATLTDKINSDFYRNGLAIGMIELYFRIFETTSFLDDLLEAGQYFFEKSSSTESLEGGGGSKESAATGPLLDSDYQIDNQAYLLGAKYAESYISQVNIKFSSDLNTLTWSQINEISTQIILRSGLLEEKSLKNRTEGLLKTANFQGGFYDKFKALSGGINAKSKDTDIKKGYEDAMNYCNNPLNTENLRKIYKKELTMKEFFESYIETFKSKKTTSNRVERAIFTAHNLDFFHEGFVKGMNEFLIKNQERFNRLDLSEDQLAALINGDQPAVEGGKGKKKKKKKKKAPPANLSPATLPPATLPPAISALPESKTSHRAEHLNPPLNEGSKTKEAPNKEDLKREKFTNKKIQEFKKIADSSILEKIINDQEEKIKKIKEAIKKLKNPQESAKSEKVLKNEIFLLAEFRDFFESVKLQNKSKEEVIQPKVVNQTVQLEKISSKEGSFDAPLEGGEAKKEEVIEPKVVNQTVRLEEIPSNVKALIISLWRSNEPYIYPNPIVLDGFYTDYQKQVLKICILYLIKSGFFRSTHSDTLKFLYNELENILPYNSETPEDLFVDLCDARCEVFSFLYGAGFKFYN